MMLVAGALLSFLAPPLSQRPIWELDDSQLCEAAHQVAQRPSSQVPGDSFMDFGPWEVECEPRVLRLPLTVLDARFDDILVEELARPGFCEAPNLVAFWNRGWHFEVRLQLTDGTTTLTRPCGDRSPSATPL